MNAVLTTGAFVLVALGHIYNNEHAAVVAIVFAIAGAGGSIADAIRERK